MNKLYSKEQIEEWASKRADDAGRLSRQLLDTMRESDRLNAWLLSHGYDEIASKDYAYKHPDHRSAYDEFSGIM